MDKAIKRRTIIKEEKEEKKPNLLKIMAVIFIGLIVIAFIVSYISNRDSSFIDEEEVMLVEPTYEAESVDVDECKERCIGYDAHGYDWDGDDCKCWYEIDEDECESQCDSMGAERFDWYEGMFKSDTEYCRCWFEMENPGIITNPFDDVFKVFPLSIMLFAILMVGWFFIRVIRL